MKRIYQTDRVFESIVVELNEGTITFKNDTITFEGVVVYETFTYKTVSLKGRKYGYIVHKLYHVSIPSLDLSFSDKTPIELYNSINSVLKDMLEELYFDTLFERACPHYPSELKRLRRVT